jgi:hypothetical protein
MSENNQHNSSALNLYRRKKPLYKPLYYEAPEASIGVSFPPLELEPLKLEPRRHPSLSLLPRRIPESNVELERGIFLLKKYCNKNSTKEERQELIELLGTEIEILRARVWIAVLEEVCKIKNKV